MDYTAFFAKGARGARIEAIGRPDLTFVSSICSQYPSPNIGVANQLNKVINLAQTNNKAALRFVPLKKASDELTVFADASFVSNTDMSSQLGYVIALKDCDGNTNILHNSSIRSKQDTRSILAAELFLGSSRY